MGFNSLILKLIDGTKKIKDNFVNITDDISGLWTAGKEIEGRVGVVEGIVKKKFEK